MITPFFCLTALGLFFLGTVCWGADPAGGVAGKITDPAYFEGHIRPLLGEYCLKCHSAEKHKGDLDLERFSSLSEIRKHPKVWQTVVEQIGLEEMPPKDKPQPPAAEREALLTWVNSLLDDIALARAGDPGPVVLRRLSNAEYTYTIRDLTGVESLDPTREFPVDGAAGEGFMNVGNALVMSPSLVTKYLDAAKEVASHAVLLPDGIRFSAKTTRRDLTEELLSEIRTFYRGFTDPQGGDTVNLQGIVFETNEGGRLPLEKYLAATLELRDASGVGRPLLEAVAQRRGLSPKYLRTLMAVFTAQEPSLLLDPVRAYWRAAKPEEVAALAASIAPWQKALWRFTSVGHIGKAGGPKAWMEPVTPLANRQDVRLKMPTNSATGETTLYLVAGDAGDGNEHDFVVWQQPRFVAPGRPDLPLREVRNVTRELTQRRARMFAHAAAYLNAASEVSAATELTDVADLARRHSLETDLLNAWLDYLGIGSHGPIKIDSYLTGTIARSGNFDFVNGWGSGDTPLLIANSSDQAVRVPGNMKPHGVAVHPSPKLQAVVGWRSPVGATIRVAATVQHAHPECGNGVTWALELRRGTTRTRLATGTAQGGKEVPVGPIENVTVRAGDFVSLLIGPRDGNHSCDLTAVDLVITSAGEKGFTWNLAQDVSPDILAGNPHADRLGHDAVWHFYTEPDRGGSESGPVIPRDSLLARWQSASTPEERQKLAEAVQQLLTSDSTVPNDSPDAQLYRQLSSLGGPLFRDLLRDGPWPTDRNSTAATSETWGLDPAVFGLATNSANLSVRAPSIVEVRLPTDLVAGCEFVTTGTLDPARGSDGSVQLQVLTQRPAPATGLVTSGVKVTDKNGPWTSDNRQISYATPVIANEGSTARQRFESAFEEFRQLFPAALCYTKIVPVDEVVTLTLFYREDHQLGRLLLDDAQRAKLDRLWAELHFVSQDALTLVDAFEQLWQFATQDADPKVFEPLREPIKQRAAAFRQQLVDAQPKQLDAVLEFADRAYRRPLTDSEKHELRALYQRLRTQELPHEDAIRLALARGLVGSAFLYRAEKAAPGSEPGPVDSWELASRLSYFLWSSMPDAELRAAAASGALRNPDVLAAQTRRMLRDPRGRRLATEFACAWLHIYAFDELSEKSERHFPTFNRLRGDMYEESIRFFADFFQSDRSVLNLLDADYTYLNEALAKFYGIPDVTGAEWRRVEGVKAFSRGGILGQATTLAKQSGASRTSPILRGNWLNEVLLGERLPRPPKDVPRLPEDEANETLTVRQLTEKHSSDPRCAGCHRRIDAYGYSLEGFDAIGRHRERDLGDRPIDTRVRAMDGAEFEGLEGLRTYLLTQRREAFLKQFCRKLLGYSLGRAVQLSDGPLLREMRTQLETQNFRVGAAIDTIVRSPQFREIRGRDAVFED